jgi:hypothetical protein
MKPCIHCRRHVRRAESACPFCGAALLDATAPPAFATWGLGAAMLIACGPSAPPVEAGQSSSSSDSADTTGAGTSTTDIEDTTTAAPTTGGASTGDTTSCGDECTAADEATAFIYGAPVPDTTECDPFVQDCPDGQKCAPWADQGSAWNATKCVPVTGDKVPGDPCTAEGDGTSGLDDCEKGAMCWDVDAQGHGICVQQCTGSPEMPICAEAPEQGCAVVGVLNFCLDTCEPLIQDCPGDDLCLPVSGTYLCVLDASGETGAAFDPCEYQNACDKGLICLGPAAANECDQGATGCCLPMCSIANGGADCPGDGQECLATYDPQPPGFEDVGYCSLVR